MTTILPGEPAPRRPEPAAEPPEPAPFTALPAPVRAVSPGSPLSAVLELPAPPAPAPPPTPLLTPPALAPAPPAAPATGRRRPQVLAVLVVLALVLAALGSALGVASRNTIADLRKRADAQQRTLAGLSGQLTQAQAALKAVQTSLGQTKAGSIDTGAVAPTVLKSVFTIETPFALGTAFAVQHSSNGGTLLVTNFHVVREQWTSGGRSVTLKQGTRTLTGKIATVRPNDDLASVEVVAELPLLRLAKKVPAVGAPVLVVGSPLGLGGTVTTGVISALRNDALQISAPISAGNSGGPVVDRTGAVVGIASAKIVSNNAEGLGFAIPVAKLCAVLLQC